MRNLANGLIFATAIFTVCPVVLAQTAPRSAAAKAPPNLSGTWVNRYQPRDLRNPTGPGTAGGLNWGKPRQGGGWSFLDYSMEQPKMQPWAEERFKIIREGTPDPYLQPIKELEPTMNCLPSSMPWVYDSGRAFELIQQPKKIVMLFEQGSQWPTQKATSGSPHRTQAIW